jgi:hypothetical protein
VTWKNSDVGRPDTPDTQNTEIPDYLDTSDSFRILDFPGTLESPNATVSNASDSTEETDCSRDLESPRTSESSGTSGEGAKTSSPIAKLEGFPYVTSVIRIPTEKPTLRARLKTFNVSPLIGIPEEVMEILSPVSHPVVDITGFVNMKRRVESLEARERETRELKRRKKDDKTAAGTFRRPQKLPVTVDEGSTASRSDPSSILLAGLPSPVPPIDSLVLPDQDFPHLVFNPLRLQRLLAIVGIEWNFDTVARCLKKAIVLRDSSVDATDVVSLPASAYSVEHITKVQNLAEFLFASSLLEEAFPLFLHVWTVRRGDFAYKGAKSLIQCVRSAASTGDQALMRALIEREMLVLAQKSPRHNLMQSLGYLELANLFQHQQCEEEFELYRLRARNTCPSFESFLGVFYEAGQKLRDIQKPWIIHATDSFSEVIAMQAFKHEECSQYYDMLFHKSDSNIGEHTLRDVLSAAVYLSHPNQPNASAGVRHIRNCLQLVFKILSSPSWLRSYEICLKRILQYLSGDPRSHEYALFLSLWVNWRSRTDSCENPANDDLTLEDENSFIGLSVVEILSVITYFILSGKTFQTFLQSTFSTNDLGTLNIPLLKSDRILGLLQIPDDDLMFGFLWCSVKLSRMNTAEGRWRIGSLAPLYKSMIIDTFDTGSCGEKNTTTQPKSSDTNRPCSAMTGITFYSTLAKSLSTTPTLASMRRQGRLSSSSTRSYWSNRAMTIDDDDLSEWASFMSISDIGNSRPVSASDVPVGDGEDIELAGQNKETSFRIRTGPSKPLPSLPSLPVNQGEDTPLLKTTSPIIIVSDSASYNKNPFTDVVIDTSTEPTVPPMDHKDSTMDHTPAPDGTSNVQSPQTKNPSFDETTIIQSDSEERPIVLEFGFPMPGTGDQKLLLSFDDQRADSIVNDIEAEFQGSTSESEA